MNKKIDEYLNNIGTIPVDELTYEYIYNELICYNNRKIGNGIKNIDDIFSDIKQNKLESIELDEGKILISNVITCDNSKKMVELGIFNKLDKSSENISKLLDYLNKKKIKYRGKLKIYDNILYSTFVIEDIDDALKVVDFVNCKLNKNVNSVNPLFFSSGYVMISLNCEYSYIEILARYLYNFIIEMKRDNKNIDYNNFKNFMINHYFQITNQIDLYKYLEFNVRNIKLSTFFNDLEEITNIIVYLFNGNEIEEFKDYLHKLKRQKKNKYENYDDLKECSKLFDELVSKMFLTYGEEETRNNLLNYMQTGESNYITRCDNLRKRVVSLKEFIVFLYNISFEEEFTKVTDKCKFEKKKKILEDICKETFKNYWSEDKKNYSKIQVARGLIRMEYGDYSAITRKNDARKLAIDNIKPEDVIELIKSSLGINYVRKEEELYELYADYIENLCIS